jgi:cytochrome c553
VLLIKQGVFIDPLPLRLDGRRYHCSVKSILFGMIAAALSLHLPSFGQHTAKRMQACTTCHGAGVSATVGRTANEAYFPRIAGKPQGYLYNQLVNFRDGRRHYGLMVGLVEHQSDAALMDMAQYFAQLQLPYPEPQAPPAGFHAAAMQRGQQLALRGDVAQGIPACASCHGTNLLGVGDTIPGLLGLPRDYMAGQIGAWQTGMRKAQTPDCMAHMARKLTPHDVNAVATWLAAQSVPVAGNTMPARASLSASLPLPCGGVK